ncbi:hypothetical protein GCM10010326_59590 [Streptomyces xanthochromogenes]|uniref:Uncharacterized protein n=1 Tax=Streptomyces xanthochromogenes TaxID=67384 RepID=A0ABQ3AMU8_9ACTN|nr:hypothetical protein GCM10010326_59590 [Streptomyces xanthochromogenes]
MSASAGRTSARAASTDPQQGTYACRLIGAGSRGTEARIRLFALAVDLLCRTAFAGEGQPVEVNEMTLDAASYVLEYDFDA